MPLIHPHGSSRLHRVRTFAAALALFCGAATSAHAQQVPAANPGRPTVATPATLTPVGYLQFETGGVEAADSTEFSSQFSINLVAKLAVASRLQLLALTQPVAVSNDPNGRETQTGDIFAGVQAVVLPGEGAHPTIALSYIGRLYEGPAPDTDIGTFRHGAMLLISNDLAGFHFDLNGMVNEQTDDVRLRRAQFGQTISVSRAIGPYTIAGELWHFTQPLTNGNAVGNLWALSRTVRPNLVLDAGLDRGLTSSSTQWEGFAGVTYLLPHRLWKK